MYNKSVVAKSMLQGLPNFWTPRVNVMMGMGGVEVQFANPTETSYYDTSPMLDTRAAIAILPGTTRVMARA